VAGSSSQLSSAIGNDPVGALARLLPTWFLVPFVIVAVLGLVGGAVLDIYSSAALRCFRRASRFRATPRPVSDGVVMVIGTIYIVFFAHNFLPQFEGFLITSRGTDRRWCGVFLVTWRYARRIFRRDLFRNSGRYGDVRLIPVLTTIVTSVIGWAS